MKNIAIIGKQFPKTLIPLINQARNTIDIIIFDWRWYPSDVGCVVQLFNQSIVRAIRRGVKVRVITPSEYMVSILKSVGCEVKKIPTKKLIHCKLMILDNSKIIIGSHNYTKSAFYLNLEISVLLHDPIFKNDLINFFNDLW